MFKDIDKMSEKMEFSNNLFDISCLDKPGMLTIRTKLISKKFQNIIKKVLKLNVPKNLEISSNKGLYLAWMSPDELLVISKNKKEIMEIKSRILNSLDALESLVLDVSSSRTVFSIKSSFWRELLAKGTPINLYPSEFSTSSFRRTRLGQVSVAFWIVKDDHIYVLCGRSFSEFFFKWLCNAADEKSIIKFF
tara:strand:+ start:30 stop:605 length:576 start_codon:yes stop_codon:yes gene_type:complete